MRAAKSQSAEFSQRRGHGNNAERSDSPVAQPLRQVRKAAVLAKIRRYPRLLRLPHPSPGTLHRTVAGRANVCRIRRLQDMGLHVSLRGDRLRDLEKRLVLAM